MSTEVDSVAAVARVLSALDHYAVLGASSDASTPELRRCYLRVSVEVHPDKNHHPEATRAFQRVAAAWAVLSDDVKRRQYDTERIAASTGRSPHAGGLGCSGPSMSPEQAFAAFAVATAACASAGGCLDDFAQVLLCAQGLARMRDTGAPPDVSTLAAGGMVLAAGLRAVGSVANTSGMKSVGSRAECASDVLRCASQVAAIGAVVSEIPAVQEALEAGRATVAETAQRVSAAIGDRAQKLGSMVGDARLAARENAQHLHREDTVAPLGSVLGGVVSWAGRARQHIAEMALPDPPASGVHAEAAAGGVVMDGAAAEWTPLPIGALVELRGLQAAPHLNGRFGQVLGVDDATGRYRVRIFPALEAGDDEDAGQVKQVRLQNIRPVPQEELVD